MPQLQQVEDQQRGEDDVEQQRAVLRELQHELAIEPVDHDPGEDAEGELGQRPRDDDAAELQRRSGHLVDQVGAGDLLHPERQRVTDDAEPEQPEVADPQRGEDALAGRIGRRLGGRGRIRIGLRVPGLAAHSSHALTLPRPAGRV